MFGIANGKPSVIDFDCGSRATQFATATAAADSVSRGRGVSEIRIDSLLANAGLVRNYLYNNVEWQYPNPAIRVYARRDLDKIFPEYKDDPPC